MFAANMTQKVMSRFEWNFYLCLHSTDFFPPKCSHVSPEVSTATSMWISWLSCMRFCIACTNIYSCIQCLRNFPVTSGSLFMSQWFFLWALPTSCAFFFISLTFPCICEGTNDSLTGVLSDWWCLFQQWSISFYLRTCVCESVCLHGWVDLCVQKGEGIVRTWPAHFACSPWDRCSWASTGAWQLPFIAVFSTLNPWPSLPPFSSSSSSSSPLLSSHPPSSTSDLFSRRFLWPSRVMGCDRRWAGCAFSVLVWCSRLVTSLTLSGRRNQAVQTESHTHTHTRADIHTPQLFVQQSVIPSSGAVKHLIKRA